MLEKYGATLRIIMSEISAQTSGIYFGQIKPSTNVCYFIQCFIGLNVVPMKK